MKRPEYVKCIERTISGVRQSWCGIVGAEWRFQDLEHVRLNGEQEGRLVACPDCLSAAMLAEAAGRG
jgi:hypothetical protein